MMCTDFQRINRFPVERAARAKLDLCAEHAAIVDAPLCGKVSTVAVPVGMTGQTMQDDRLCERPKGHDGPCFCSLNLALYR